jgi:hemerythrin-like domain-containing protein
VTNGQAPDRAGAAEDPLAFILSEHMSHRRMCEALDRLAAAPEFDPAHVAHLADFIRFDLMLHVINEEEDFFPLLRKRCPPEDDVDQVLDRMTAEHAEDTALSARVRDALNASLIERRPPSAIEGVSEILLAFARREKRHLTLENAVIVPLARRRLSLEDLAGLRARFIARRRRLALSPATKPHEHFE